jgi:O-antigen/teichoic acid export membrane protein
VSPEVDKSQALGKTAKKGIVWSFLREGVSEVLLFPTSMLLARMLKPEEFGIAAAALFFILLGGRLSELGFNAALIRSKHVEPIHLSTVFVAQLALGVVSFAVMVALAPWIGAFYGLPQPMTIVTVSALSFLIMPFGAVPSALLQRNLEFRQLATIDWVQLAVMSVANLVLAFLGFSYMSLVYGRIAQVTASTLMRMYYARWRPSLQFSGAAFREIAPSGTGFFVKRLLDYSAQNGDNMVVGRVLGLGSLGLYDKAYSTMDRFLSRLNTAGPGMMFRIFAVIHEEPERFSRAYQKVLLSASMVVIPVFAVMGVMAPQVIVVLFGSQWRGAAVPFAFMCVTGVLKLLNAYASAATQAAGLIWSEVWRQLLYIGLIVVSIMVLSPWGPSGAAAGVLIATASMSVLMHVLLFRATHLSLRDVVRPLVPPLVCSAGAAAVAVAVEMALRLAIPDPNPWLLVFCQAPPALLFIVVFALFAPYADLRALVLDVSESLVPKAVRQHRWAKGYFAAPGASAAKSA